MNNSAVTGSCLCGNVSYQITNHLGIFQYCHCSRCRKFTGSANAANLFVRKADFQWLTGEDQVGVYYPPLTKYFATAFCKTCGSSLPWQSKGRDTMVIPAGTLDDDPGIKPVNNVFYASKAPWHVVASDLPTFDELPPRT